LGVALQKIKEIGPLHKCESGPRQGGTQQVEAADHGRLGPELKKKTQQTEGGEKRKKIKARSGRESENRSDHWGGRRHIRKLVGPKEEQIFKKRGNWVQKLLQGGNAKKGS